MRPTLIRYALPFTLALLAALPPPLDATPVGTVFTYQGRLQYQDMPAHGLYDLELQVYDGSDPDASSFLTSEADPTVASEVKDGVSWGEIAGIPPGFADGIDIANTDCSNWTANVRLRAKSLCCTVDGSE